jgi:hypothetical protein
MRLKTDVPYVLHDAYSYARDAKNAKEFIQTLANTRRTPGYPPKQIIDVPRVGSVIKTRLTSCNYEVVAVYGDRMKVRKINTNSIVQLRREEVTNIVRGRLIPATSYDHDSKWLERVYSEYLLRIGYSLLTEYYNKVQKQIKNKKTMEQKKEMTRLQNFNNLLKLEMPSLTNDKEPEPTGLKGLWEALQRPAIEIQNEIGDADLDEVDFDMD